jgi:hypothetical protein
MKGKRGFIFPGLVLAAATVFLAAEGAEAFCVYNKTDKKIIVNQIEGQKNNRVRFYNEINSGDNKCCHWSNKDCNRKGKKDSTLKFTVTVIKDSWHAPHVCQNFAIKAGGWLTVRGTDGHYNCEAHY